MAIKSIKTWTKKDNRVYVTTDDNREGCYFINGNSWNTAKTWTGNLTEEEKTEARKLGFDGQYWNNKTFYSNETSHTHYSGKCPDCGGYNCNTNCTANR